MRRNALVAVDHLRQLLAHQAAHFARLGMVLVEPVELQAQRIELDAHVTDDFRRGRGQGGALRFEPQFGAADHLLDVALVDVGPRWDLYLGVVGEHPCGDNDRQRHCHDTRKTDPVEHQPRDRRGNENREDRTDEIGDPLHPVVALHARRTLADRGRAAVPAALAIVAHQRFAFGQYAIAFAGEVVHGAALSPRCSANRSARPASAPGPGLRRARYSPSISRPRRSAA